MRLEASRMLSQEAHLMWERNPVIIISQANNNFLRKANAASGGELMWERNKYPAHILQKKKLLSTSDSIYSKYTRALT
jgi:hypothetical protein